MKANPYEESLVNPNTRDEVLKLLLIVEHAPGPFSREYLKEKVRRIYEGTPLAIHPGLQAMFNAIKHKEAKVEREAHEGWRGR